MKMNERNDKCIEIKLRFLDLVSFLVVAIVF
jgi:hypothetical protein